MTCFLFLLFFLTLLFGCLVMPRADRYARRKRYRKKGLRTIEYSKSCTGMGLENGWPWRPIGRFFVGVEKGYWRPFIWILPTWIGKDNNAQFFRLSLCFAKRALMSTPHVFLCSEKSWMHTPEALAKHYIAYNAKVCLTPTCVPFAQHTNMK